MPVSPSFLMPSVCDCGKHTFVPPTSQSARLQSDVATQPWPVPHFAGAAPPQSVPVSPSFLMPSVWLGGRHTLVAPTSQSARSQSLVAAQPWPVGHFVGAVPPQSTPVSPSFLIPSSCAAGRHFFCSVSHFT